MLLLVPVTLLAQTGTITGRVTEAGSAEPVAMAVVSVMSIDYNSGSTGVYTDASGHYTIGKLKLGRYQVTISQVGYRKHVVDSVSFAPDETVTLDVQLEPSVILLDGVVVTASRTEQKILDAPASVSVVNAQQINQHVTMTPTEHLRGTAGVDIAQTGLVQQSIVVRGFNNVFSGTLMMLTDNRMAGVPSLRLNAPYLVPVGDDDLEYIEVVRGPGSALYGPNASNGVVNMITRSPFSSQGTSVSLTTGNRSIFQGNIRHAGTLSENVGYKISALYFRGDDWKYTDPVEQTTRVAEIASGKPEQSLLIGRRDPAIERYGAEARMDFLLGDDISAIATAGVNELKSGIELSDLGAAQAKNWRYSYLQGRLSYGNLFVQAFLNKSDAGDTYLLRAGNPIVDRSSQFVAQAQHSTQMGENQRFVYGVDYNSTKPVTDGTITGRNENEDNITEYGGYLQSETSLFGNSVDLVLAGRYDKHSQLNDAIFSPRAGVVVKPAQDQSIRLTYNRAFTTPTTNDLFLDLVGHSNVFGFPDEYAVELRASGVPKSGYSFARDAGGSPLFYSPFSPNKADGIPVGAASALWPAIVQLLAAQGVDISGIPSPQPGEISSFMALLNPESESFDPVTDAHDIKPLEPTTTEAFELGYKGMLGQHMQIGVDVYRSTISNFIGPLQNFTPNVFLAGESVTEYLKPYIKGGLLQQGVPEPQAEAIAEEQSQQLGAAIGQIPLGTVSPQGAVDPTAILLASRNFGKVTVNGIDFSLDYRINPRFSVQAMYSFVDNDYFENLDNVADLALNAPSRKGSLSLNYAQTDLGLSGTLRYRWAAGFRMHSGVYDGTIAPGNFIDASMKYDFSSIRGLSLTVSSTNLLNKAHQGFIGAPALGRLVLGKISYSI